MDPWVFSQFYIICTLVKFKDFVNLKQNGKFPSFDGWQTERSELSSKPLIQTKPEVGEFNPKKHRTKVRATGVFAMHH